MKDNNQKPVILGESVKVWELLQMRTNNFSRVPSLPQFSKATGIQQLSNVKVKEENKIYPHTEKVKEKFLLFLKDIRSNLKSKVLMQLIVMNLLLRQ